MRLRRAVFPLLLAIVLLAVAVRFIDYVVQKNFIVYSYGDCDPSTESCFSADCDPVEDPECDQTPYTKITIPARVTPACLLEYSCDAFECDPNVGCEEIFCSEESLDEGEVCTPYEI